MPVGGFPGLLVNRRKTHRAPVNPMDKSTVISIYPKSLYEVKHTIQPGIFKMEPGSIQHPTFLTVGPSSWWKEVDEEQPLLEIPCGSNLVADAIVKDYCNGVLGSNMINSMPGLFWVPGTVRDKEELIHEHKKSFDNAVIKQDRFWKALVRFADTFWARTNGSPLCISDEMRLAAVALGLTDKEWMKDFSQLLKVKCPACGSPCNPDYPVCPVCKAIVDEAKAKKLQIKFAM